MFADIYKGKSVLVTGHTGFKGSWLSLWLCQLGAEVTGLSIGVPTEPSNYEVSHVSECIKDCRADIRDADAVRQIVEDCQPDFVFHLAAQALVRKSYENPLETFTVNALGSANVLEALRGLEKPVVAVMITSDKAYDNVEWVWGYRETDRLGGKDPYSASKGMAELAIRSYVESFFNYSGSNGSDGSRNFKASEGSFKALEGSKDLKVSNVRVGITRAGNVIGGGDWAADRIVPDCMKAWSLGEKVDIRNPGATRPWQHVLEPLSGYLALGAALGQREKLHGQAYNFGPPARQNYSVKDLIDEMGRYWKNIRWNDVSEYCGHVREAGLLKLNCDKALADLNWLPVLQFQETVEMTTRWYKKFYQDQKTLPAQALSMRAFSTKQIEEYVRLAALRDISWADDINGSEKMG